MWFASKYYWDGGKDGPSWRSKNSIGKFLVIKANRLLGWLAYFFDIVVGKSKDER
jgi:hypothetical protein